MNKPRIIIWFVSNDGRFIGGAINILTRQFNGVDIIGVTAAQQISIKDGAGKVLPFIPLNEISMNGGYDIILVAGARNFGMSEVTKVAKSIGLDTEKLLGDWIACIPGFTLQKYRQLQRSQLSIFSRDCFGGLISNTLGLSFRSPFVNLMLSEKEWLKFLKVPHYYMEEKLTFKEKKFLEVFKHDYPEYFLGDIVLSMLHYPNFDEAVKKWYSRKNRINWYNLFVTMHTESQEILEQFDALPYGKKVCFVPFKSKLSSAFYIDPNLKKDETFGRMTHLFARGDYPAYYDMFDMLLYGKKTPLIKM